MARGWLWCGLIAVTAAPLAPRGPWFSTAQQSTTVAIEPSANTDWVKLLDSDPVAALAVGLNRYRHDVKGFTATLHKQERIGKTLHHHEVIEIAVREQPFAVSMTWTKGVRNQTVGSLFATGENGGSMRVWRPQALFAKTLSVGPTDALPRSASRYAITESSLAHGHLRTYLRWKAVRDAGELDVEHLGKKSITELNGRVCHVLKRTCRVAECDPFVMSETPEMNPAQAFTTVMIYLDAQTGYQIGAELLRADGERVGAYFFCDVVLNPVFTPGQFSEANWK